MGKIDYDDLLDIVKTYNNNKYARIYSNGITGEVWVKIYNNKYEITEYEDNNICEILRKSIKKQTYIIEIEQLLNNQLIDFKSRNKCLLSDFKKLIIQAENEKDLSNRVVIENKIENLRTKIINIMNGDLYN